MRFAVTALAVLIGLGTASLHGARQATAGSTVASDYHFSASTGLLVFHVHRDRTADFEVVMQRVAAGLKATSNPVRREQAIGWRVFRARDTSDMAIFVVLIDPVVRDADYDPVKMITEFAPADATDLYERLRSSVARVERLDLSQLPTPIRTQD